MKTKDLFHEVLSSTPPDIKKRVDWSFAISDRIDARLKELNITQRELARRTGCKEPDVCKWISGQHNFTIRTLAKISVALDIDLIKI